MLNKIDNTARRGGNLTRKVHFSENYCWRKKPSHRVPMHLRKSSLHEPPPVMELGGRSTARQLTTVETRGTSGIKTLIIGVHKTEP
eukprot:1066870-Prorocentrum_minimum.AAC.1